MECSLGWNHMGDFKIEWACSTSLIWNHKYDFRPKLHDTRFNYHFITSILKSQDLVSSNILLMQYWAGLKLNSSIFGGEKVRVWKQKLQNLPHDTLCLSFSCNLNGYLKQALNLIGCFVFSVASSLAGKKMQFKAKNGAICE